VPGARSSIALPVVKIKTGLIRTLDSGERCRMEDQALVAFLRSWLPQLGLRWPGYRKVRGLVRKRLRRRLGELGLSDLSAYLDLLVRDLGEQARLAVMCRIPISRFYRDRATFDVISYRLLPEAAQRATARGDNAVRCWSAGCASGEEPYTLAMAWRFNVAPSWPALRLTVTATDAEETMIERAKAACYNSSSLKELPREWCERAFVGRGPLFCLTGEFRENVCFLLQDIRQTMPDGPFDLILCRNLVFTYFDEPLQRRLTGELHDRLLPGGYLVLGSHETVPAGAGGFTRLAPNLPIYRSASPCL
jgi:chemotaxis protein methyltransferase CheR